MTTDSTPNPYAAPLSDALPPEADPEAACEELARKRRQQATALAMSWITGGLLTAGLYGWFFYDVWSPVALSLMGVSGLISLVWIAIGGAMLAGSQRAESIGLIWSYLAAAFFLTHLNLLAAAFVALLILQGHRLKAFDRELRALGRTGQA